MHGRALVEGMENTSTELLEGQTHTFIWEWRRQWEGGEEERPLPFPIHTPVLAGTPRDGQHTRLTCFSRDLESESTTAKTFSHSFFFSTFYLWNGGGAGQGCWGSGEEGVGMEVIAVIVMSAWTSLWQKSSMWKARYGCVWSYESESLRFCWFSFCLWPVGNLK